MFAEPRYDGARAAARQLKARIKDEHGSIISAFLTLMASGGPDVSVAEVLGSVRSRVSPWAAGKRPIPRMAADRIRELAGE